MTTRFIHILFIFYSYFIHILFFGVGIGVVAQPKLGQTWQVKSSESIETPLGFQYSDNQEIDKGVMLKIAVDKANKIVYLETRSPQFKVQNYTLGTALRDFKNYTYTRYFEGWGYYLRINEDWCAYFGKSKPNLSSKPLLFFNYDFKNAEGKPLFDADYQEVLLAGIKAEQEKKEKKQRQKQIQQEKKMAYQKAQELAKKQEEKAKQEELARKEKLKKGKEQLRIQQESQKKQQEAQAQKRKQEFEAQKEKEEKAKAIQLERETQRKAKIAQEAQRIKKQEEDKKRQEEERKIQYAKELAEFNAKKEAEKKAQEAERLRKSEEFRTGQKTKNIKLAQQSASIQKVESGQELLDQVLKTRIKKSLADYLKFVQKNKKYTEAYPLVLLNYKDLTEYSSKELASIKKIVSTTVFRKGHKRCDDFQEKGKNGVIIIKAEM